VLRIPLYGDPGVPDPALASTPSATLLASLLYSGLVKFGPDMHVIPEVAASIPTISNDGKTYTFTIRRDARFGDGHHCTAYDVAYSLARALRPEIHSEVARRYLGGIKGAGAVLNGYASALSGVRVIDRLTVRIRLTHPDTQFLEKLALPVASIVNPRVLKMRQPRTWVGKPLGTGAWDLVGRHPNGTLELVPRSHPYSGSVQVKSLLLVPVRSQATALDLYKKGALDVVRVPADQYSTLSSHADFHDSSSLDAYYALPQSADGELLASHLDREKLIQKLTPVLSSMSTIVPPAVPDYDGSPPTLYDQTQETSTADPTATMGFSDPVDWSLLRLRDALSFQWGSARHEQHSVRLIHAHSPLPDPLVWLRLVFGQTKSLWYRRLLAHNSRLTNDPVSRMNGYSRAENWALAKGLIIPLASGNIAYLIKPYVQNLQVSPLGLMPENNTWSFVSIT
jgi:ABC-type oligopeptide transport system substrate-binding subunit